eukprot:12089383-Karenia_brevis.AAC.1
MNGYDFSKLCTGRIHLISTMSIPQLYKSGSYSTICVSALKLSQLKPPALVCYCPMPSSFKACSL